MKDLLFYLIGLFLYTIMFGILINIAQPTLTFSQVLGYSVILGFFADKLDDILKK